MRRKNADACDGSLKGSQIPGRPKLDRELLGLEQKFWAEGFSFIGGVDEVGRGPLAGPVVAACVVLPRGVDLPAVDDSKRLSEKRREELYMELLSLGGIQYGVGVVDVEEIDRLNILRATHLAMRKAVMELSCVDFLLVDGNPVPGLPYPSESVVKGDSKSASIASASIIAKVTRDHMMVELDRLYPGYGFAEHKGYGTALHLENLRRLGPSPVHRKSFGPVKELLGLVGEQLEFWD